MGTTMMLSALFVFLQLCSLQMTAFSMPTCQVRLDDIKKALKHLNDMTKGQRDQFPVHCIPYNAVISLPSSALPASISSPSSAHPASKARRSSRSLRCPAALSLLNETLVGTQILFEEPGESVGEGEVTWNRDELERFRGTWYSLKRQTSCLPSVGGSGTGVLTPYFSNVTAVIQQQESAVCGLEALRRDLLRILNSVLSSHTC